MLFSGCLFYMDGTWLSLENAAFIRLLLTQIDRWGAMLTASLTAIIVSILCFTELRNGIRIFRRRFDDSCTLVERIRPITFCMVLTMYFGSAFLPIYAVRLSVWSDWFSDSLAAALPISASALCMGICSYVGGVLFSKWGGRRVLLLGGAVTAAGCLICSLNSYLLLVLGKAISGGGIGLALAVLNAVIAQQPSAQSVERGFALYYAAYFAALNVGVVSGGWTAAYLGYSEAFCLAGAAALVGMVLTFYLLYDEPAVKNEAAPVPFVRSSAGRFLQDRFVCSFLFLLYAPYLIAGYFMYYFFPLFAEQHGFDEAAIAQIFLLNGLSVVYLGPRLAPVLIRFWGEAGAAIFGSVVCMIALGFFAWSPELYHAVWVVIVLGLADSFVYTAQASYYMALPAVAHYGAGRASGMKNVVENIADTAAPFLYGGALLAGIRGGITMITAVFGFLLLWFGLMIRRR